MIFLSILIFIVAIALPSFKQNISPILLIRISTIMLIYAGALSLNAFYIQSIGSGIGIYSGLFHVTCVSQLLDTFILFISAFILTPRPMNYVIVGWPFSPPTLSNVLNQTSTESTNYLPSVALGGRYSLIVLFSILGSLLLVSSSDLISMYLSIELQSFGLYILATLYRDSKLASSAGLKYFLLGGLSSCLILLGAGLIYSYTGLTNLESIYNLISVSALNSTALRDGGTLVIGLGSAYTLGFMLIIIGFLFKIAAAPLHNWSIGPLT
jgi:NADH-ubiquinone oxidoreductase chain 2